MAETPTGEPKLQLYVGPIVGLLVLLFALTHAYERAELVSYDWTSYRAVNKKLRQRENMQLH